MTMLNYIVIAFGTSELIIALLKTEKNIAMYSLNQQNIKLPILRLTIDFINTKRTKRK